MKHIIIAAMLFVSMQPLYAQADLRMKIENLLKKSEPSANVYIDTVSGQLEISSPSGRFPTLGIPYTVVTYTYLDNNAANTGEVSITCPNSQKCIKLQQQAGAAASTNQTTWGFGNKEDAHTFIALVGQLRTAWFHQHSRNK